MKRVQLAALCALLLPAALGTAVRADVKTQEKSLVKFEGALGKVIGFFGGKAAKEGITSSIAVKGDRKITLSDYGGEIVDLAEEKVYQLDTRNKTYKVKTFAEIRKEMQEAQAKAEENARRQESREAKKDSSEKQKEYEFDVSSKETGQKKNINGFDCREVITTIAVREKGKTLEQGGGMVLTADSWLGPKIPAMEEIADFNQRYARKLEGPLAIGSAEQMAAAMAMYPALKQALSKYETSGANLDGTPIQTTVTFDGVKSQEQMAQEQKQQPEDEKSSGGIGGMLGGFGRKITRKKPDEGEAGKSPNRATIMTMTNEVLSVATAVTPQDVTIPAGYREKN